MNRYFFALITLFSCFVCPLFSEAAYHLTFSQKDYPLATYFEIDTEDSYPGVVKVSAFRVRTNYDLSDIHGWQATGIHRIASLGSVFAWATDVDIYNTDWKWIGMIDGQMLTLAEARFNILNEQGQVTAIAYLDDNLSGYTITYPESEAFPIARLYHTLRGENPVWHMTVYDETAVDERVLRIFAAMAANIHPHILDLNDEGEG